MGKARFGTFRWPMLGLLSAAIFLASFVAGPASAAPAVTSFTDAPDPARVGEELTYTASVKNGGTEPATNAKVRIVVPEGTRFASSKLTTASGTRGCPSPAADGGVTCRIGDMGAGEEATMELVVVPTEPGWLRNLADVSSDGGGVPHHDLFAETEVLPPEDCTVVGTGGPDELVGTSETDTICAFGGDDTISGAGGDDSVYAGTGDDTVRGQAGGDTIRGGEGTDEIVGGADGDEIYGGRGPDTLRARDGVNGNDEAYGGHGKDSIFADREDRIRD